MTTESIGTEISSDFPATTFFGRAKRWAGVRILLELGGLTVALVVVSLLLKLLMRASSPAARPALEMAANLLMIPVILIVYSLLVRWLEQRRAGEISLRASAVQLPVGFIAGMALMASEQLGRFNPEQSRLSDGWRLRDRSLGRCRRRGRLDRTGLGFRGCQARRVATGAIQRLDVFGVAPSGGPWMIVVGSHVHHLSNGSLWRARSGLDRSRRVCGQ